MSDILADYREWRDNYDRLWTRTHHERCHMYHPECMAHRLAEELASARLTAAEREAIAWVCGDVADITGPVEDTLHRLLERTNNVRT